MTLIYSFVNISAGKIFLCFFILLFSTIQLFSPITRVIAGFLNSKKLLFSHYCELIHTI